MTSLDDAWAWYQATTSGARVLGRLGRFWGSLPWEGDDRWVRALAKDNVLRDLTPDQLTENAEKSRNGLDDLAVLVLFSVFEANVRSIVELQVRPEILQLTHPALKKAGDDVLRGIGEESFFRVLDLLKSAGTADLIEQVNQVRRYRNWVAHGRRQDSRQPDEVEPRDAYERLSALLVLLQEPP